MAEQVSSGSARSQGGATPAPKSSQVERSRCEVAVATKGTGMDSWAVACLAQNTMSLGSATPSEPAHLQAPTERHSVSSEEKMRFGQWPPSDVKLSEGKRSRVAQGEGTLPAPSPRKLSQASSSTNLSQREISKQPRDQRSHAGAETHAGSLVSADISRRRSGNQEAASSASATTTSAAPTADLEASDTSCTGISTQPSPTIGMHQSEERSRMGNTTGACDKSSFYAHDEGLAPASHFNPYPGRFPPEQLHFEGFSPAVDSYAGGEAGRSAADDRLLCSWKSSGPGLVRTQNPLAAQISMGRWRARNDIRRQSSPQEYDQPDYNDYNEMRALLSRPAATNSRCGRCAAMVSARRFPPGDVVQPDDARGEEDLHVIFGGLQVEDVVIRSRQAAQLTNHIEMPVHTASSDTCSQCGGLIVKQPGRVKPSQDSFSTRLKGDEGASSPQPSRRPRAVNGAKWKDDGRRDGVFRVTSGVRHKHDTEPWPAGASLRHTTCNTMPNSFPQYYRQGAAIPQAAMSTPCSSGWPSRICASKLQRVFQMKRL